MLNVIAVPDLIVPVAEFRPAKHCQAELVKEGQSQCVICLSDFAERAEVRRLSCLHLFHTSCVDAWLLHNRVCPVCRVDVEASAAQFRSDWPLLTSNIDN